MSKLTLYTASPFRIRTIDTSTTIVSDPVSSLGNQRPFTRLLADTPRSLVYRVCGSDGLDEFDVSDPKSPTVTQLKTNKGATLLCAALAGGFGQPSHVDQRLYCGSKEGFIYTFPLDSNGKTRKTTSDPAPYEVLEAHGRPIVDLAVASDGTHAFALIQSSDGKAAAVTKDLKPMPHPPQAHYFADRPQWDTIPNPRHINLTPDERHLIVTGGPDSHKCTIIDPTKTESRECWLADVPGPGPLHVDNNSAYFTTGGKYHNINLASGTANFASDSLYGDCRFIASGAGYAVSTTIDASGMKCGLAPYNGSWESRLCAEYTGRYFHQETHKDMVEGVGVIIEGG